MSRRMLRLTIWSGLPTSSFGSKGSSHGLLDGEIVCLDKSGKSQFKSLMYRRGKPYFYAFDILQLNGEDVRSMPLHARKRELKRLIPEQPSALLYVDHIEQHGERLFHLACREDLEGIVAKLRNGGYDCQHSTSLIKIRFLS